MSSAAAASDSVGEERIRAIVPPRAVLTELCRGFLMVHEHDRRQAALFAQGFLRERAGGPPAPGPMLGVLGSPARRRGAGWVDGDPSESEI